MNHHMPKEFHDLCFLSIEKCKKCIDEMRETVIECELQNIVVKCANDITKSLISLNESNNLCQKTMEQASKHIQECQDQECNQACNDLLVFCKDYIKSTNDIEIECNKNLDGCIDAVKNCMEKCKLAIKSIEKCLKVLKSKNH